MSSLRGSAESGTRKALAGLAKDTLQSSPPITGPFCFKEQKELGKDDFTKIPNGARHLAPLKPFVHRESLANISPRIVLSSCCNRACKLLAYIRAKAPSRWLRRRPGGLRSQHEESSAPKTNQCAWTIRF